MSASVIAGVVGGVLLVAMLVSVPRIMRGRDSPPPTFPWWVFLLTLALLLVFRLIAG